jgi:hypothetical protein
VDEIGGGGVTDVDGRITTQVKEVVQAVLLDDTVVQHRDSGWIAEVGLLEIEGCERCRGQRTERSKAHNQCERESHAFDAGHASRGRS